MNAHFLEATSLRFFSPHRPFRLLYCRFALGAAILFSSLLLLIPSVNAQEEPVEGGTLPGVTITEAEARNIMKGLFDFTRFSHTMAIGKIARDERLTTFTDGFVQRNNIEVLTIGYIDSDHFWPRVFREQRLAKIDKAPTDNLLAAKIIFMPDETDDGTISGYNITLELTGKSQQVYDLLQVSRGEIDSIASQTSQQQLNIPFAAPNEARETVVNALIAALEMVEGARNELLTEETYYETPSAGDSTAIGDSPISGLHQNANFVSIVSVSNPFTPGETRMEVTYTVKDSLALNYVRLDLYRVAEGDTTEIASFGNLAKGVAMELIDSSDSLKGWSGTMANGEQVEPGSYLLRLTGSVDEQAANGYFDFSPVEVKGIEGVAEEDVYNFIVSDGDAWYREKEAPYKAIKPDPSSNILAQGLQVSVLEVVKDGNDKEVAKLKRKDSEGTEYTTLSNLTEVKMLSKELKYKMVKDYTALKLPYSTDNTDDVYKKDAEFIAYKVCGDYVKVKGEGGDVDGHWIHRDAAAVGAPTYPITADQLDDVFTSTSKETLQEVVDLINTYSTDFGLNTKERMAHFIAQIGHETGGFKKLGESCSYSKANSQLKSFSKYQTSVSINIAVTSGSTDKSLLKQMQNPDLLNTLTQENAFFFDSGSVNIYKIKDEAVENEHIYETLYNGGDGIKTKYLGNKTPDCPLFDYVYCCNKADLGNGDVASKEGSLFRGRGYIHLTGKFNYNRDFYGPWKNKYPDDKRTLNELVDLLRTDKDLAMQAAMVFWEGQGLNELADNPKDLSDDQIAKEVTKVINSGLSGLTERQLYFSSLNSGL